MYVCLICSGDPKNLSVTNELAIPPNDEHNQMGMNSQEEPSTPSGRKGSQKSYFYTNPPRYSTDSMLDNTSLADELDSQKTPYIKLSPFTVRYIHTYIYIYIYIYLTMHFICVSMYIRALLLSYVIIIAENLEI